MIDGETVAVVGALDLDESPTGIVPRRLPAWTRPQIPDVTMEFVVQAPSGVRLRLQSDTTAIELDVMLTMLHWEPDVFEGVAFDLVADGAVVDQARTTTGTIVHLNRQDPNDVRIESGEPTTIRFANLAPGPKTIELWLPQGAIVELRALRVDDVATVAAAPDDRRHWVHYGSSISHCLEADSPTGIWPAVAAQQAGVSVTNLGFGGQCMLDQFVARSIRDLAPDVISLKIGINIVNGDTLRERTFGPALHGFLDTIRERLPVTPILLVSPIFCPPAEDASGADRAGPRRALAHRARPRGATRDLPHAHQDPRHDERPRRHAARARRRAPPLPGRTGALRPRRCRGPARRPAPQRGGLPPHRRAVRDAGVRRRRCTSRVASLP